MKQALENILASALNWYKENTADTFLDNGFRSPDEQELFEKRTEFVVKECLNSYSQLHIDTMEKYYKRYLDEAHFHNITLFIREKNELCKDTINLCRSTLLAIHQKFIIKLNSANCQNEL